MSFCLDVSSPVLTSEPRLLRLIDRLVPCWVRPCVSRWAATQVDNTHIYKHTLANTETMWRQVVRSGDIFTHNGVCVCVCVAVCPH